MTTLRWLTVSASLLAVVVFFLTPVGPQPPPWVLVALWLWLILNLATGAFWYFRAKRDGLI